MDYTNEILARLQNGESVEDIAAKLTNDINTANQKYQEEKRLKAEAEARKQAQEYLKQEKIDVIDSLKADLISALTIWEFDSDFVDEIESLDPEEIVNVLDQSMPFIQKYVDLQKDLQDRITAAEEAKAAAKPAEKITPTPSVDPIEDFLNNFVRL